MNSAEVEKLTEELKQQWHRHYESVEKPGECLYCSSHRVNRNGSRKRTASVLVLNVVVYLADVLCRRVKCAECRQSWTLRPPGLIAHKHYQPCVISQALSQYLFEPSSTVSDVAQEHECSRKTVRRWVCWVSEIANPAILMQKVMLAMDAPLIPRLRHVTQLARKARTTFGRLVLEKAAEVLGLLEDLCNGWGLEPPGLRAVVQQVVGDRSGIGTYARPAIPELVRCIE